MNILSIENRVKDLDINFAMCVVQHAITVLKTAGRIEEDASVRIGYSNDDDIIVTQIWRNGRPHYRLRSEMSVANVIDAAEEIVRIDT